MYTIKIKYKIVGDNKVTIRISMYQSYKLQTNLAHTGN